MLSQQPWHTSAFTLVCSRLDSEGDTVVFGGHSMATSKDRRRFSIWATTRPFEKFGTPTKYRWTWLIYQPNSVFFEQQGQFGVCFLMSLMLRSGPRGRIPTLRTSMGPLWPGSLFNQLKCWRTPWVNAASNTDNKYWSCQPTFEPFILQGSSRRADPWRICSSSWRWAGPAAGMENLRFSTFGGFSETACT